MEVDQRNWAELPGDVLSLIFHKLAVQDILQSAEAVCRPWRLATLDPHLWRSIHISCTFSDKPHRSESIARKAIHRSTGLVESFSCTGIGSDELLAFLADRAIGLKYLHILMPGPISGRGLGDFIRRCPKLVGCRIIGFSDTQFFLLGDIGRVCPEMRTFGLIRNNCWAWTSKRLHDEEAREIAFCMPQLYGLVLFGSLMSNGGLHAILDNCHCLRDLNINGCPFVDVRLDPGLRAKLGKYPHEEEEDDDDDEEEEAEEGMYVNEEEEEGMDVNEEEENAELEVEE